MSFKPRILGSLSPTRVEILCMAVGEWEKQGPHNIPIYSTEESLRASVELFRDLPVSAFELKSGFFDHLPQILKDIAESRGISFLKNQVGWIRNPHFGTTEDGTQGIIAEFEITDPEVAEVVSSAIKAGQVDLPGFSVDGNVSNWEIVSIDNKPYDTFKLERIDTLDIVNYPAAGGKVLRLAASKTPIEGQKRMNEKVKSLLIALLSATGSTPEAIVKLFDDGVDFGKESVAALKKQLAGKKELLATFEALESKIIANEDVSNELSKLNVDYSKSVVVVPEKKEEKKPDAPVVKAEDKKEDNSAVDEAKAILEQVKAEKEEMAVELGTQKIETEIQASTLPAKAKAVLRERLVASKTFKTDDIRKEIDKEINYIVEIGGTVEKSLDGSRITASGLNETDLTLLQCQAMFSREPIKDTKGNKIEPFKSLRQLSNRVCGSRMDCNMSEVWDNLDGFSRGFKAFKHVDEQGRITGSLLTTDLTQILGVSMHRQMMKDYGASDFNIWRPFVEVMSLDDIKAHTYQRLGVYPTFAEVSEGGTYQSVTSSPTDEEATMTLHKYGAIEDITEETILNDDMRALSAIPRKLAEAMAEDVMRMVLDPLYNNDAVAYGSDTDTIVIASTHLNGAASGGSALSDITLTTCFNTMPAQIAYGASGTRNKLGAKNMPKYILVGPAQWAMALKLTNPNNLFQQVAGTSGYHTATQGLPDTGVDNMYKGIIPVCVPYWASSTNWWALADPQKAGAFLYVGFLNGKDTPELVTEAVASGSEFTADKKRMKVKMRRCAVIADHRPVYGQLA
jgi:hypothetical protein